MGIDNGKRSGNVDSCIDLRRLCNHSAGFLGRDHCLHDEGSADRGVINMGPARVCTHPVGSGACAKLTMFEASRPGLLWLLLFYPADVTVPAILYGSNRGRADLSLHDVVMSSVDSHDASART